MGEKLIDDLARALVQPMPRRRAVRIIGASIAAAALHGVSPRLARAQVGCTARTCRGDRRCCQKGAEADFATYCCPAPSWQWFCGGRANNYRCINQCVGRTTFPCTASIPHPESGINGICCDRRYHIGCTRIGPPAEKRPDGEVVPSQEWKPSCCPRGFGFCGGLCCEPPNRCKDGRCVCPDGSASLDGRRCCPRGQHRAECLSVETGFTAEDTHLVGSLVGVKCCPSARPYCCGTTCCGQLGCCGTKCCPAESSRCASWRGRKICCPKARVALDGGQQICCPAGTRAVPNPPGGCCPPSTPECCGSHASGTPACGPGKICVRGTCVAL